MNDEIKEILDIENYRNKDGYVENINLSPNEIHKLSDYIINLQNELKYQKEMEDEYIEKHTKLLQDFTNLQKENERLNTELNAYKDEFCKDTIKEYELVIEQEDYKSRCEKATELIEKSRVKATPFFKQFDGDLLMPKREVDKLLNLLNGGDEE